jgi:hypothetical protein
MISNIIIAATTVISCNNFSHLNIIIYIGF